jgi:glycosyltransferase involved in cell wall biosynthesis
VDDGSTDKSGEICDEYAGKDRRVIVCHKTNGGVASSRNTGIGMAKGRYICFIDSDDFVRGDYLEKLHTAILKSDSDMAICSWKEVEDDYYTADDKYDDLKYMIPEPDWLYHELMYNNLRFVFLWDKLYKKELFRDVVLPENMSYGEDAAVYYRILHNAARIVMVENQLYYYRNRSNSVTRAEFSEEKCLLALDAVRSEVDFYIEKKKQPYFEIALDSYFYRICESIRICEESGFDYSILRPYISRLKHYVRFLKISKTCPLKKVVRMYYIAYIKYLGFGRK